MLRSSGPIASSCARILGEVVAAVEVQRFDVEMQASPVDIVEGGFQQFEIAAVRAVNGPPNSDTVSVGSDRPFPSEFRPIHRASPGPGTAAR